MSIKAEYLTLLGLEQRLNEIDQEDDTQFTAILSLNTMVADTANGPSAVAILITKTEKREPLPVGDAQISLEDFLAAQAEVEVEPEDVPEEDVEA